MRIIAIDPGTTKSAFVSWDTKQDDFVQVDDNCRLGLIENTEFYDLAHHIVHNVQPELIAVEMIQSYGLTVGRSTFLTVLFVGTLVEKFRAFYLGHTDVLEPKMNFYGRPTIKAQVGGKNDAQIRASLRIRYGEAKKGEKLYGVKKDIWSALALATALTERPDLKLW